MRSEHKDVNSKSQPLNQFNIPASSGEISNQAKGPLEMEKRENTGAKDSFFILLPYPYRSFGKDPDVEFYLKMTNVPASMHFSSIHHHT